MIPVARALALRALFATTVTLAGGRFVLALALAALAGCLYTLAAVAARGH